MVIPGEVFGEMWRSGQRLRFSITQRDTQWTEHHYQESYELTLPKIETEEVNE